MLRLETILNAIRDANRYVCWTQQNQRTVARIIAASSKTDQINEEVLFEIFGMIYRYSYSKGKSTCRTHRLSSRQRNRERELRDREDLRHQYITITKIRKILQQRGHLP